MDMKPMSKERFMNENPDRSLNIGLPKKKEGEPAEHFPGAKPTKPQVAPPDEKKREREPNHLPGERRNGDTGERQGGNIPGS
jgi:hypothetical protein